LQTALPNRLQVRLFPSVASLGSIGINSGQRRQSNKVRIYVSWSEHFHLAAFSLRENRFSALNAPGDLAMAYRLNTAVALISASTLKLNTFLILMFELIVMLIAMMIAINFITDFVICDLFK
jgi:hypothetical protein